MAPIATSDLKMVSGHTSSLDQDSVFPSANADKRLKKLWMQHGDIQSSTYSDPELTSIGALVKWNARVHPHELAYLVPRGDTFNPITWLDFDRLTDCAAAQYSNAFQEQISRANTAESQPTIALLGAGHTFQYWISQLALTKLNVRLLLLSDKNSSVARDHLLETCDASGIVVEQRYLASVSSLTIPIHALIEVAMDAASILPSGISPYISKDPWNEQSMIIHSSGSTGLPKPIIHTNRSMMLIARMYRLFQSFIVENWYLCFPMYHIAGVSIILGGVGSGLPTTFGPELWPPSPGAVLSAWKKLEDLGHPVDCLHCAPAVIEDLYEFLSLQPKKDFSPLTDLKILQPGGAALSPAVLERLVDLGANMKTTYGSTEIGPPCRTIPCTADNRKCYSIRSLFPADPRVQFEPQGEGLFECVVYKGFPLAAELWPDNDAPNPYRTNDLFLEDPPNSGFFVLQGRKDDIVVHSNGEKTNALPLQMAIEECHPAIHKVIVLGTGKPCTSAVLELSSNVTPELEEVFAAIDGACKSFPTYSRLDKSMILVLPPGEQLPVTPKGNVRRKEVVTLYGASVDGLYSEERDVSGNGASEDESLAGLSSIDYLREVAARVCEVPSEAVEGSTSFYAIGLDSQKAVRLRSRLARRFGAFPLMFIFEYPSPSALCHALSTPTDNDTAPTNKRIDWIKGAIRRYSRELQTWSTSYTSLPADTSIGQIIYLTGATGALGNALLAASETDPTTAKIYCAVRGSNAQERLEKSLRDRGYGPKIYNSRKFVAIPYDMKDSKLGLDEDVYQQLAREVTTVVHNAWRLDFNQQVEVFEDDCLRGTLNLMHFAFQSTKKTFAFTSSVAVAMGKSAIGTIVQEEPIADDPSLALETGYAQSKFIIEVVAQEFAAKLGVPVRMCRVGQLCGHSSLGSWNTTEMFPIMVATGLRYLAAMPTFAHQTVNWLPVDICAQAIRTVLTSEDAASYSVHNLVNPATITWSEFLDALQEASGVAFERIGMDEWVSRLHKLSEEKDDVPGSRLLGFFEGMARDDGEESKFENSGTAAMVPALAASEPVNARLIALFLQRWRETGFA